MAWGKVGGQAPQGRGTKTAQRKSRLSAQLDLILVKEPHLLLLWAAGAVHN